MPEILIPTLTLSPRGGNSPPITITTNAGVTVYITDEVTIWSWSTSTATITKSVIISSFIPVTTTSTTTLTTQSPTTITSTTTLTPSPTSIPSSLTTNTSLLLDQKSTTTPFSLVPTSTSATVSSAGHGHKHVDPYQVLTIVFGVFILVLLALMYWLVRRFYKMYRAERVLRKQLQTEGTEMPAMNMVGAGREVVDEE